MLSMFQQVLDVFSADKFKVPANQLLDPTIYKVETQANHLYVGQIIFQDDMVIRLRCDKHVPVKILKTNIKKINVLSTPLG